MFAQSENLEYNYVHNELNIAALDDIRRVKQLISTGFPDFDQAFVNASYSGHIDIMDLLLSCCDGITCDIENLAIESARRGDLITTNYLINLAADNIDEIIIAAAENNHYHIIESITYNVIESESKYRRKELSLIINALKYVMSLTKMLAGDLTILFHLALTGSTKSCL